MNIVIENPGAVLAIFKIGLNRLFLSYNFLNWIVGLFNYRWDTNLKNVRI